MNRVELIGRITHDIEVTKLPSGDSVVSFSLAVNDGKDRDGNDITAFIDCVVFGTQADNLARYQGKGSMIGVSGKIRTRSYETRDGNKRKVTEIVCQRIEFLSKPNENAQKQPDFEQFEQIDLNPCDYTKQPKYDTPDDLDRKISANKFIEIDEDDLPFY